MHFVYVLERLGSQERYIGYTQNTEKRLEGHNTGNTMTTKHAQWSLIYYEGYTEKMDAIGREKFLKSGAGWRFLKKQLRHYLAHHSPAPIH
jgi:putative endonuclease